MPAVTSSKQPVSPPRVRIPVLLGPTASGKTALSLLIAPMLGAEIISADSRQIYKYLDIGTAKPTPEQRSRVPHHMVDMLEPDRDYNAGEFGKEGRNLIGGILKRGHVPLVVGGSGLYIRSLMDGFFEGPGADPGIRKGLADRLQSDGPERLLEELGRVDPVSAAQMLPSNTRRIMRALEVHMLTGMRISDLQKQRPDFGFEPVFAGLAWERSVLYRRIDDRAGGMIAAGLIGEVRSLLDRGYPRSLNSLQTTGYIEVFDYFDGKSDEGETLGAIRQNTRRYAKRQMTWFRPDRRIKWFDVNGEKEFPRIAGEIVQYFRNPGDAVHRNRQI